MAYVQQIQPPCLQASGQFNGFFHCDTSLRPVGDRQTCCQRKSFRPDSANCGQSFQQEADAVVEVSAVVIRTLVGQRRIEFVSQITVGEMQFQPFKPGRQCSSSTIDKALLNPLNVGCRHFTGVFWQMSAECSG